VALAYDSSSSLAPRVVASGYGKLAERIIESARDHGVFVHDSPELVGLLMNLDLDDVIPQELYMVVAELLVWVAELEREKGSMRFHAPR
jgi:flagellar biosynthesis protein